MTAAKLRPLVILRTFLHKHGCVKTIKKLDAHATELDKVLTRKLVNSFIKNPEQATLDSANSLQQNPTTNRKPSPNRGG